MHLGTLQGLFVQNSQKGSKLFEKWEVHRVCVSDICIQVKKGSDGAASANHPQTFQIRERGWGGVGRLTL